MRSSNISKSACYYNLSLENYLDFQYISDKKTACLYQQYTYRLLFFLLFGNSKQYRSLVYINEFVSSWKEKGSEEDSGHFTFRKSPEADEDKRKERERKKRKGNEYNKYFLRKIQNIIFQNRWQHILYFHSSRPILLISSEYFHNKKNASFQILTNPQPS